MSIQTCVFDLAGTPRASLSSVHRVPEASLSTPTSVGHSYPPTLSLDLSQTEPRTPPTQVSQLVLKTSSRHGERPAADETPHEHRPSLLSRFLRSDGVATMQARLRRSSYCQIRITGSRMHRKSGYGCIQV